MTVSQQEINIALKSLGVSICALLIAQLIKFIIESIKRKKLYYRALISTGGFPSSHCALVTALSFSLLALFDFKITIYFVISLVSGLIVAHDAMGVRLQASKHAEMLNDMNEELSDMGIVQASKPLKEMLGHQPLEVLGGIILGIVIALIGWMI